MHPNNRQRALVALALALIFFFQRFYILNHSSFYPSRARPTNKTAPSPSSTNSNSTSNNATTTLALKKPPPPPRPKLAYVTFLSSTTVDNNAPDDEDHYFTGARVLAYQLLHDPKTRTRKNIPFVVAVSRDVPSSKRERLIKDGAQIQEVERLTADWIETEHRYSEVMTKLRIASWYHFDRVMFLDVDTILTQPLDGIFHDPAARVRKNLQLHIRKNDTEAFKLDEGDQPRTYVFAGTPSLTQGHKYPPMKEDENLGGHWVNGGFWVMRPRKDLFDYYVRVLNIRDRFGTYYPEECLLNYVHRDGGNMPWSGLNYEWGVSGFPSYEDYQAGVKSLHEKFWQAPDDLKPLLEKVRWQMDGYWKGLEEKMDGGVERARRRFRVQDAERGAGSYGSGLGTSGG
ncbi:hypothetical protein MMC21_007251 [Puttea exsequens]|nr:hypothetical protein [Puttea exsequens]